MVEGRSIMRDLPNISLVGCGYWGKNLCRNFNALGALAEVVDSTEQTTEEPIIVTDRSI